MATLLKLIYRFNIIPIKIQAGFFEETDKLSLNSKWLQKKTQRRQNNLEIHYYIYSQVILHMETKAIQLRKKYLYNKLCRNNRILHVKSHYTLY